MAIKNKKSIVFSIIAIIISTLLLLFFDNIFFNERFDRTLDYEKNRIISINEEFKYIKDSVISEYLTKSVFFSFDYIFLNETIRQDILTNKSYKYLNEVVKNLVLNSTYNSNEIVELNETNFIFLMEENKNFFEENYNLIFDFEVLDFYFIEKTPYSLDVYLKINYSIQTYDNIANWEVIEEEFYEVNILGLYDPLFFYNDFNVTLNTKLLRPENFVWELDDLKNDLLEESNFVYFREKNYSYTIGNSFLNSLLQKKFYSYKDVVFNSNFDSGFEKEKFFDNSQNENLIEVFSNTLFYMNFDNKDINLMNYSVPVSNLDIINDSCYKLNCSKSLDIDLNSFEIENFTFMFRFNNLTNGEIINSNILNISYNDTNDLLEIKLFFDYFEYDLNNEILNFFSIKKDKTSIKLFLNGEAIYTRDNIGKKNLTDIIEMKNSHFDEVVLNKNFLDDSKILDMYENKISSLSDYVLDDFNYAFNFDKNSNYTALLDYDLSDDYSFLFFLKPNDLIDNNVLDFYNSSGSSFFNINIENNILNVSGIESQIEKDKWYLIVLNKNLTTSNYDYFLNSNFIGILDLDDDLEKLVISNYSGLIDEIKFRNKPLENSHIKDLTYNFNSIEKGCCNYIILLNPNKFGYNSSSYLENVSYDSTMFFDYVDTSNVLNISLYTNISGLTTLNESEDYYNFKLNYCIGEVLSLNYSLILDMKIGEENTSSCFDLIRKGYY